jgi:PIN domain nuclease of toxin-antitoxin system
MSIVMIDTHVAVALYKGRLSGLSRQAQRLLDGASVRYSPIVDFELELLNEIGRIQYGAAVVCQHLNRELDIAESGERLSDIVRHALPLRFTRDPFDRLIVAHADLLRAPLITLDQRIHQHYSRAIN